jgi:error-prone DNA polymerase
MGCFQIESHGQMHLLGEHQPEAFGDLVTEIALFRPGPLQGDMVHPFVRRRQGREPVAYDHPDLEPVLRDTYGVILFQEQVLEVAHRFAGMSLDEADAFRTLMSKFRDPGEMAAMRGRFVGGAMARGVPEAVAEGVFERVSKFVGYGFCRSHAAAFAKTVYHSCYLKAHHPAAFLAAVMQHRPGLFTLLSLQEEARRFGVATRGPDVRVSGTRYDLEPVARGKTGARGVNGQRSPWAVRMPLTAVKGVEAEAARALVWARLEAPFAGVEDLWRRAAVPAAVLRALARAGALDGLVAGTPARGEAASGAAASGAADGRRALWELGVLERRLGAPGGGVPPPSSSPGPPWRRRTSRRWRR